MVVADAQLFPQVDYDTDRLIQQTLNTELKDFTLITIGEFASSNGALAGKR